MSDMRELYQEVILDHNKQPRNFGKLAEPTHLAKGHNPLCGDQVTVYLKMDGDRIGDIKFEGQGCAISKASASLMTTLLKGKTAHEAQDLFNSFRDMVAGEAELDEEKVEQLGKLAVFCGVRDYPARVKCASLAWHALHAALESTDKPISTE